MKRLMMILGIAGLLVTAGLLFTFQYAAAQRPDPGTPGGGYGRGWMMGGAGPGVMHTYMQAALADKLGITVEELQQAYADGKTFWDLAEEKGYSLEEARQMMIDARNEALDKAVEAGAITQEQAEWMKQHMTNMPLGGCHGGGYGSGYGGGMMGRGWRWNQ